MKDALEDLLTLEEVFADVLVDSWLSGRGEPAPFPDQYAESIEKSFEGMGVYFTP